MSVKIAYSLPEMVPRSGFRNLYCTVYSVLANIKGMQQRHISCQRRVDKIITSGNGIIQKVVFWSKLDHQASSPQLLLVP